MKHVITSTSVEHIGANRLAPHHLWELAARLFRFRADRWRRRALFYRRYREYFPHLSSSRFVERCLELDQRYRRMAEVLRAMQTKRSLGMARAIDVRGKHGNSLPLSRHPAIV